MTPNNLSRLFFIQLFLLFVVLIKPSLAENQSITDLAQPDNTQTLKSIARITVDSNSIATIAFPSALESNWTYTNANKPGSKPTPIRPDGTFDIILPAQIGDKISYEFSGRINTPSTSGLILSVWSIGGSSVKDWSSGVTGIKSVVGFATVPSNNINSSPATSINATITNTVKAADIDANGMVTLRLFGANTGGSGTQTHVFIDYPGNGVICQARGINFRNNPNSTSIPVPLVAYPNKTQGVNLAFTTTTNAWGIPVPVNPSGAFDVVLPAKVLDYVSYHLEGAVTATTGLRFSVWSIGGKMPRSWTDGTTTINSNSGIFEIKAAASQAINATIANRVISTDLDANNKIRLRLYVVNSSGSGTQHHTFLGKNNSGSASFASATNYQSGEYYALTDTQAWEGASGSLANSEQEPSVWVDNSGNINMLYTGGTSNHTGWATATNPQGPWTKYAKNPVIGGSALVSGAAVRNSILYKNGILYVYFAQENGNLYVASGVDPAHLKLKSSPIFSMQGNIKSLENTAVVQGPSGVYYMFFEGLNGTGNWQLGVATASTPLGPFTLVKAGFPLKSLEVYSGSATDGPWVEWTGSKFRMVYHATPVADENVPSEIYTAESVDGVHWNWPSLKADGLPAQIRNPFSELGHNQAADPFILRYNNSVYLYHTEQADNVTGGGGIVVNDPTRIFNSIDF